MTEYKSPWSDRQQLERLLNLALRHMIIIMGELDLPQFIWAVAAAGGGGGAVAYAVVKIFGEKWLDSKFSTRLQDLRHEHERQMEAIRLQTARAMDRSTRLSEREFVSTAEAWSLVYEAYVRTMGALPGFRQHADFSRLSDDKARIVAAANDFEEWEVEELLAVPQVDRNIYFSQRVRQHEKREARRSIQTATGYLKRNMLFIERSLYEELDKFVDWAWQAILANEMVQEAGPGNLDGIIRHDEDFRRDGEGRIKGLENQIRERFWLTDAQPVAK